MSSGGEPTAELSKESFDCVALDGESTPSTLQVTGDKVADIITATTEGQLEELLARVRGGADQLSEEEMDVLLGEMDNLVIQGPL